MPLSAASVGRERYALVEAAAVAASLDDFRVYALSRIQRLLGFDSAVYVPVQTRSMPSVNKDARRNASFMAERRRYSRDLEPIARAAKHHGGVALDTEVLSARERDRLGMYAEIVRPQGCRSILYSYLNVQRGALTSVLSIARHGSKHFTSAEADALRAFSAALSLADRALPEREALHARGGSMSLWPGAWERLTRREREIAEYLVLGYRNSEIAMACGTSINTIRNQLVLMYRHFGVANRTGLAAALAPGKSLA